jgi:ribonucleotide reductase alpha subunit
VQKIDGLPDDFKRRFRTAREMDQRLISLHAKARAPFICQTMSLNYYFTSPTLKDLATIVEMADKQGLKTISYYMHSKPATGSQKTSVKAVSAEEFGDDDDDTVVAGREASAEDGESSACSLDATCTSCKL